MCTLPEDDINSAVLIMWLYVYCIYFIVFGQCLPMLEKCDIFFIDSLSLLSGNAFFSKDVLFRKQYTLQSFFHQAFFFN